MADVANSSVAKFGRCNSVLAIVQHIQTIIDANEIVVRCLVMLRRIRAHARYDVRADRGFSIPAFTPTHLPDYILRAKPIISSGNDRFSCRQNLLSTLRQLTSSISLVRSGPKTFKQKF